MRNAWVRFACCALCLGWGTSAVGQVPPDSLQPALAPARADTQLVRKVQKQPHSPRKALLRSFVVPGWGQIYNKQWYKAPFVYAGLGTTGFFAARNAQLHRDARHAFLYATGMDKDPNPYAQYEAQYAAFPGATPDRLFTHKNSLRRNRDLSFFAIGVVYALTALDAYINAHLVDFDIGPDLSPNQALALPETPGGLTVRARVRF